MQTKGDRNVSKSETQANYVLADADVHKRGQEEGHLRSSFKACAEVSESSWRKNEEVTC